MNKSGLRVGVSKGTEGEKKIHRCVPVSTLMGVRRIRRFFLKCPIRCHARACWMVDGGWSTSLSPFRRVANAESNSFATSSKRCDQAAYWRKPSSARVSEALSRRNRLVSFDQHSSASHYRDFGPCFESTIDR